MLHELFQRLNELSGNNQFLSGAIAAWCLGVITYICRKVPNDIYAFGKKQLTLTVTVTSYQESFHTILKWLSENGYEKKFRKLKLTNGRYGNDEETKISVGYGRHLFWYKRIPMLLDLSREATQRNEDKEILTITKLGRSHKIISKLVAESVLSFEKNNEDFLKTYESKEDWLKPLYGIRKRYFSSIYLSKDLKDSILKSIQDFISKKEFYIKNGIPYHLGILLYGPPGTGKTSLVKVLASELNMELRIAKIYDINHNESQVENQAIVLVEDIDVQPGVKNRSKNDEHPKEFENFVVQESKECNDTQEFFEKLDAAGLSKILNDMDGITSQSGRIIIFTTNHIENLDPAILRPGRIDYKFEIGYVNLEAFNLFCQNFYGKTFQGKIKESITISELQQEVLSGTSFENLIEKYSKIED